MFGIFEFHRIVFVCVNSFLLMFFFFKQKTAYEMLRSLVGSEMCIRDRFSAVNPKFYPPLPVGNTPFFRVRIPGLKRGGTASVSYTHLTLPTSYSV